VKKNPVAIAGLEPGTQRPVVQRFNHFKQPLGHHTNSCYYVLLKELPACPAVMEKLNQARSQGGFEGVQTNPPRSLAKFIFNETAAVQGTIIKRSRASERSNQAIKDDFQR